MQGLAWKVWVNLENKMTKESQGTFLFIKKVWESQGTFFVNADYQEIKCNFSSEKCRDYHFK